MALCHWRTGSKMAGQAALPHRNIHPEKNNPYHSCVSESLPRDAVHNQNISDYWLLQFLQYCK